jgi:SulP family sulfate permease
MYVTTYDPIEDGETKAPKSAIQRFFLTARWAVSQIPENLRSGVTVSLVNIPLSIALSIAGGGSPVAGIVTAFWSGIVAAFCGGSEFNIVGPTGALSGILSYAAVAHTPAILPWLAIWTGVMSLLVWRFKLVDYLLFVPNSVVHGFTVGVAIIIGFGQYDNAMGMSFKHNYSEFHYKLAESFYYVSRGG